MKRLTALILSVLIALSLASCAGNTDETSTTAEDTAPVTEEQALNHDSEPEYVQAVKTAYDEYRADADEDTEFYAYMTDLNGDGYRDIVLYASLYYWQPVVLLYDNGKFTCCEYECEVMGGSLFPSGEESGFFMDTEKHIIVIRYDGHTFGTVLYRAAQAYEIKGNTMETLWVETYDENAHIDDEEYTVFEQEDWERVDSKVREEYDTQQYLPRIKDYNLVNLFDVYAPWDGSVLPEKP